MTLAAIAFLKTFAPAVSFAILFLAERARPAVPAPRGDGRLLRNASLWLSMAVASPLAGMPLTAFAATHAFWLRPDGAPTLFWFAADLVILDCWTYFAHRAYHRIPMMWRLHAPHHLDEHLDTTSAGRFHPLEILISLAIKMAAIVALGIPVVAVILFEVVLNVTSMFNHSNASMPASLDRVLRLIVVTPDMHRVHHSILRRETDSNFGFNLPWWDRLFGTYRAQPEAGHTAMTIGIPMFRDPGELRIDRLLTQPFRNDTASRAD